MSQRLRACVSVVALVIGTAAWAQTNKTTTDVEKYPDGSIRVQDTKTTSADGKTPTSTVRTEYDESGRPMHETETTFQRGITDQTHDRTWVYDDKGRLIYFESIDSVTARPPMGGIVDKYRLRKKYNGDADTTGTTTSEQVYASVTGRWRDFDEESGQDIRPSQLPLQPLKPKAEKKPKTEEKSPAPDDGNGLPLPERKTKVNGGINWMHAPQEVATSLLGFDVGVSYAVAPRIWVTGDFARVSGSSTQDISGSLIDQSVSRTLYLGGVMFTFPEHGELTPFARGWFGAAHDSNTYLTSSYSGTTVAMGGGGGVLIAIDRNLSINIALDLISTRFGMDSQQNLRLSGGISYGFGGSSSEPTPSGPMTVSLENPHAGRLARAEATLKAAKAQADKAEADMKKADPAWMKQNLTDRGQKAVEAEKADERKAASAFEKAGDDLDKAQTADLKARTKESATKVDEARDAVKEAETELDAAERAKRQQIQQGMTKAARDKYKKIADAYDAAQDEQKAAKDAYDKWNKANGIK